MFCGTVILVCALPLRANDFEIHQRIVSRVELPESAHRWREKAHENSMRAVQARESDLMNRSNLLRSYGSNCSRRIADLPRIAIVQHAEESIDGKQSSMTASAFEHASINCYASRHGIPLYVESLSAFSDRSKLRNKLLSVMRHLQHFQWIMFADLDTIVVNYNISVERYLDDSADVILPDRDNGEVGSYLYFVKNSCRGRAFLAAWISYGGSEGTVRAPHDNGDLMELLPWAMTVDLQHIDVQQAAKIFRYGETNLPFLNYKHRRAKQFLRRCTSKRLNDEFLFEKAVRYDRYRYPSKSYFLGCVRHIIDHLRPDIHTHGIKLLRYTAGPVRGLDAHGIAKKPWHRRGLTTRILPSDFILHGKQLHALLNEEDLHCSPDYYGLITTSLCLPHEEAQKILQAERFNWLSNF